MKNTEAKSWQIFMPLYILVVIISFVVYGMIYGYLFPSSNLIIHIPYIKALLDPQLYTQDFYVQEAIQFTPRYYYQILIALPVKLGMSIPLVYFSYYFLAFASFLLALYGIGRRFDASNLAGAVIVFLVLNTPAGTVGYTDIFRPEPIPAVYAMGIAIWGIYFCLGQRWRIGYLFFGLACLIQFLVGFLPGMLWLPLIIIHSLKTKNLKNFIFPLLILGFFISLVYIPMLISGTTNSDKLSNSEFIYWYGYIRNPHHIIPSAFPIQTWRSFIFLMFGGLLCVKLSKLLRPEEKRSFIAIIFTSIFALGLGYVFVELYPMSLVAKLQLARTTPFAKIIVIIAISTLFVQYGRQKNLTICSLLLLTPIIKNGVILFGFTALILLALEQKDDYLTITRSKLFSWMTIIGLLLLLIFYPLPSSIWIVFKRIAWKTLLFSVLLLPYLVQNKFLLWSKTKIAIWTSTLFSILYFILSTFQVLPQQWRTITIPKLGKSTLASKFQALTPKNSLILVPPSSSWDKFRLDSERSIVFSVKSLPFTDAGIKEWSQRFKVLVPFPQGPKIEWEKHDQKYIKLSSNDLLNIARSFGADYILTNTDWHPNLKGTPIAQEGKWVIYQIEK